MHRKSGNTGHTEIEFVDMLLAPEKLFEKLEFDKILTILEEYCLGEPGKMRVRNLEFQEQKFMLDRLLDEVAEFCTSLEDGDDFPQQSYPSLTEEIRFLKVEGFVLSEIQLVDVAKVLRQYRDMSLFFSQEKREKYPILYDIFRDTIFSGELLKAVDKVVDEEGKIRPDASPELRRILNLQQSKRREMDRAFRAIVGELKAQGYLKDTEESFRNGRRVLTVASEHKRKIRGIIHDESATGKTAYVEPEAVISINNDLFELYNEEKREIFRILRELTERIRPYLGQLSAYLTIISRMDLIQAKARLARSTKSIRPKIEANPVLDLREAFHPLLYLKNSSEGKKVVPFSLHLNKEKRILVLSGPNAGGKSICLKSIGLIQLMAQAGMLVPVGEESIVGIFSEIFIDIGDEQSLENELSTYSSRLTNMKYFLENSSSNTLVLIDEFGSGTDPKIGGAIAEAMLAELNSIAVFGVITTHYSNLKLFAFDNPGILNGSMTFDQENLSPTYQLETGKPGSSYAYEIALKSGLSKKLIDYAKNKTGKNEKAIDELLVQLQKEKAELLTRLEEMSKKEKDLDKLIKAYETMSQDLDVNRKRLKLEKKNSSLQQEIRTNKELEKLIREIRETKNVEKAKQLLQKTKATRKTLSEEVSKLNEEVYHKHQSVKKVKKEIEVGDFVRLISGGGVAKVLSIQKKKAEIAINHLRMYVHMRDLEPADNPVSAPVKGKIQMDTLSNTSNFVGKLDLRGMRKDEALKNLESFIDEALMANGTELRIIHGKGDGILRKAVKQKLREFPSIISFHHEEPERGGDGVTVVLLGE